MSTKNLGLNIQEIFARVALIIEAEHDKDMAAALGMRPATFSNWKDPKGRRKRGIPFADLFRFAQKRGISFDWLLTGEACTQIVIVEVTRGGEAITRFEWSSAGDRR